MHMTQGSLSSAPHSALRPVPRPFGVTRVQGLAGLVRESTSPAVLETSAQAANAERLVQRPVAADDCDDEAGSEWSEDAVVQLHWILLCELRRLADPHTPLDEKLDTLDWALAEPEFDERPFSLANCIRVVGLSPLSPAPYVGSVDVEEIKAWIAAHAKTWLGETISLYPDWVQKLIRANPHGVANRLAREPQWINRQIKLHEEQLQQGDLFGTEAISQEQAR